MDPFTLGTMAGLGAAGAFGVADFLAQRVTRDVGWLRTMLWLQIGSVPLLVAAAFILTGPVRPTLTQLGLVAALGLVNTVAAIGLYRAFEVGQLSVVSPVVSCFGAVTAVLTVIAGDAPPIGLWPGLVALVLGIALASATTGSHDDPRKRLRPMLGFGWALLSAVAFGTAFFGVGMLVDDLGPAWPIAGFRFMAIPFLLLLATIRGDSLAPPRQTFTWALAATCLDTTGMFVYTLGTTFAHIAVVAVLSSLFSAITVALAQIWLRERLQPWQWLGLVAIFVGTAWIVAQ